jgi:hypothetical protein
VGEHAFLSSSAGQCAPPFTALYRTSRDRVAVPVSSSDGDDDDDDDDDDSIPYPCIVSDASQSDHADHAPARQLTEHTTLSYALSHGARQVAGADADADAATVRAPTFSGAAATRSVHKAQGDMYRKRRAAQEGTYQCMKILENMKTCTSQLASNWPPST